MSGGITNPICGTTFPRESVYVSAMLHRALQRNDWFRSEETLIKDCWEHMNQAEAEAEERPLAEMEHWE